MLFEGRKKEIITDLDFCKKRIEPLETGVKGRYTAKFKYLKNKMTRDQNVEKLSQCTSNSSKRISKK